MNRSTALRLIDSSSTHASHDTDDPRSAQRASLQATSADTGAAASPAQRLFAHWVWMMGKNPTRCAIGPKRARVLDDALKLYDEETLMLAIEGCAASPWHAGRNDRNREYNDIELILRDEAHIERFAAEGEALRERLARHLPADTAQAGALPYQPMPDHVRTELKALAAKLSQRVR